ncbi:MAG TPA: hypothetical protein DEB39_06025 [Planctomycetaceae bacterium]|nr:hypothetical protein [Planctomycetaceae bacterium]
MKSVLLSKLSYLKTFRSGIGNPKIIQETCGTNNQRLWICSAATSRSVYEIVCENLDEVGF